MKASDLPAATRLDQERSSHIAFLDRLREGDRLALMLGEGSRSVEIVLSSDYAEGIRRDLLKAFEAAIAEADKALARLGVEP